MWCIRYSFRGFVVSNGRQSRMQVQVTGTVVATGAGSLRRGASVSYSQHAIFISRGLITFALGTLLLHGGQA
jgi:hypothetical protein